MTTTENISAVLIKGSSSGVISVIQDFLKENDGGVVLLGSGGIEVESYQPPKLTRSQLVTAQIDGETLDQGTKALNWQLLRVSVISAIYQKYLDDGSDKRDARLAIERALKCGTFDFNFTSRLREDKRKNFKQIDDFYIRGIAVDKIDKELAQAAKILGKDIEIKYRFNKGQGTAKHCPERIGKEYIKRYAA